MGSRWKGNGLLGITNLDSYIYSKDKLRKILQERRDRVNKFREAKEATRPGRARE
ncbi:hypothetical protein HN807_05185 [Candidatus Bathyarchaeota archaeon]|jgi:hypothetical protein|nr:hypothetical protein [Candidatus Bathyarchaeota archaeon]MBT4319047.1 hypothetical protein [Candidatus Bathyarchaeota archaeon]MBT4423337.1 hypothetical protein [Candidatus Bathyarchaeota archaeon]MBT7185856.1 hypothetical protein [Candidatus Bathyarchaeota archaeon]MBT7346459.1 hypothetical protein [Candidatus Bathyarchaeota archaeon]